MTFFPCARRATGDVSSRNSTGQGRCFCHECGSDSIRSRNSPGVEAEFPLSLFPVIPLRQKWMIRWIEYFSQRFIFCPVLVTPRTISSDKTFVQAKMVNADRLDAGLARNRKQRDGLCVAEGLG